MQEDVARVTQDGKPSFVGSQQDVELAGRVFDLMVLQGRFYGGDAPIRLTLPQLSAYFVEQGLEQDAEAMSTRLDEALKQNSQVFYREESEAVVSYTTSKNGHYAPSIRPRMGALPTITTRHMSGAPAPAGPTVAFRHAQIIPRDTGHLADLSNLIKMSATQPVIKEPLFGVPVAKEKRPEKAGPAPAAPKEVKKVPQVETPQGVLISLAKSPTEILAKHHDFFSNLVQEKLAVDPRFISFGNQWLLAEKMTALAKGELRQVREFIETSGGPESDESLCANVFNRPADTDPSFRFSLDYQLAAEKRVFEFVGTASQNLWWVAGATSPRIVRAPLKLAEIGQDLKFLEDEAPVGKLPGGKWVHTLTFYEWENGVLPYSPEAKLLFPQPLLKEQKIAQLRFEAPQFETAAYVELHYPTGNRGGWIEGLGEILAVFVSGAKLIVARNPDKPDTYTISYEAKPVQETTVLLYDAKRQRLVFQPLPLSYQTDESYLLERQRFSSLKDARRLEDVNRRKGDAVIIFAFEKMGVKVTREEKPAYRARLEDLLPVINIEKPFSKASLLRFFVTHPHYQRDEAEEGYYFYIPD